MNVQTTDIPAAVAVSTGIFTSFFWDAVLFLDAHSSSIGVLISFIALLITWYYKRKHANLDELRYQDEHLIRYRNGPKKVSPSKK